MNADLELQGWRTQWHTQADARGETALDVAKLRMEVIRSTRRKRLTLAIPVLVTLYAGIVATWFATSGRPGAQQYAIGVWVFLAATWAGMLYISRGTWTPRDESTAAFIHVTVGRYRSSIRAVPLAVLVYVAELLFFTWLPVRYSGVPLEVMLGSWPFILLGWIGLPLFTGGMWWWRLRSQRRLAYWEGLQRELQSP